MLHFVLLHWKSLILQLIYCQHGMGQSRGLFVRFFLFQFQFLSSGSNLSISSGYDVVFTRGQFWPSGIVVACVCVCVCPCVRQSCACPHDNSSTVQARITKFGPVMCKRPWLRSLLFCGAIDLDLQGQIELKSQNLPHFEHVNLSAR